MNKLLTILVCCCFSNLLNSQVKIIETGFLETSKEFYKNLEYDSAFAYAKKDYDRGKYQKNDSLVFTSALELYKINDKLSTKDSTDYFTIAANIAKRRKSNLLDLDLYYAKAHLLYSKDEYADALPLFLIIDSISKANSIKNKTVINAIIRRSEILRLKFTKETSEAAERLLLEALQMSKDIGDGEMINYTYTYLADVCGLNDKYREFKYYNDLAFDYYQKKDDVKNLSQVYLLKTAYYLGIDDLENAKRSQEERIRYLREKNDVLELARALNYNGSFHRRKTKDYGQAIKSLEEAKSIYNTKITYLLKTDNYNRLLYNLAYAYQASGNYKLAFDYLDEATELSEDILKKTNKELTSMLETKYETAKKEKEIALLTSQKELGEQRRKNQTHLFLGILSLGVLMAGFLFYAYRNKLKTAQKLKELDALKSKFFTNVSHEFRTPLTLIKSPLQLLKNKEDEAFKIQQLGMIEQHSDRMLELVDQLLQLSKIDSGNLKLILRKAHLSSFLESLVEPFKLNAEERGFKFSKQIEKSEHQHWFDKDVVEKITTNLLTNALKYTPEGESIVFESNFGDNQLKLSVSNSTTLQNNEVPKLFERFHQEQNASQGFGIGLALVKELVALYKGSIDASVQNKMLTFHITLPLDKDVIKDVSLISENHQSSQKTLPIPSSENLEELPIMLVADDNADIRSVLKTIFKADYHILEAPDGNTALKLAIENIPDIIISDVMMPEMNGFELTENLKQTSDIFIPSFMIPKTSDESKLRHGIEAADGRLFIKPFPITTFCVSIGG
ncbi:MAG: response regulator [Gelidibacter sp.]